MSKLFMSSSCCSLYSSELCPTCLCRHLAVIYIALSYVQVVYARHLAVVYIAMNYVQVVYVCHLALVYIALNYVQVVYVVILL